MTNEETMIAAFGCLGVQAESARILPSYVIKSVIDARLEAIRDEILNVANAAGHLTDLDNSGSEAASHLYETCRQLLDEVDRGQEETKQILLPR